MCLDVISKKFKGTGKKERFVYKIVRKNKDANGKTYYTPYYIKLASDEWYAGKWYHAKYDRVIMWCSRKTNHWIERPESCCYGKDVAKLQNGEFSTKELNNIRPTLSSAFLSTICQREQFRYECGIHFFWDKQSATSKIAALSPVTHVYIVVVKCKVKGLVSTGRQWYSGVGCARQLKIIREV